MSFTPGPWTIHDNIGKRGGLGIMADGAPCIVAIMGNAKAWPVEANANARLIAAAPELLSALIDCVESLSRLKSEDGACRVSCIQQAKSAILKAQTP